MGKIIAIDFDNTLFQTSWPEIISANKEIIQIAKEEQAKGAKLILWTCREGQKLEEAVEACKKQGLIFDAINDNLPEVKKVFGNNSRKIVASEYWDDKGINAKELECLKTQREELEKIMEQIYGK